MRTASGELEPPEFGGWRQNADRPPKTAILIAKRIVQDITQSGYGPGAQLPSEKVMVETYGVGRGTLREALRYLELQGVLRIKAGPGGGPIVTQPDSRHLASTLALLMQFSETKFRDVVEVRILLEPLAAEATARNITPEQAAALRDSVDAMEEALDNHDEFLKQNDRFHSIIAFAAGNPLFAYLQTSLHWITDGSVLGVEYPPDRCRTVWRAHDRIATAIEKGDPEAARSHMDRHMRNFLIYLEKNYPHLLTTRISWSHVAA